ncbi:MAG: hypothetical protein ACI399_03495 [Candidatus Cryptobacteroides sp.]
MAWEGQQQGKAPLPNFRDWVPDWGRVALYFIFLSVFQFTNGMYFTAFEQMKGGMSLSSSDVSMMGQTVLIGLSFYFPLAFRLKFRFSNRTNLLFAATVQLFCNLVFPHLTTMPARLLVCYLGGFCRLYGTFECFSNLLPRITPSFNYAVFLSVVFFIVLGCINVFDWIQVQIVEAFGWQAMHFVSIGCLLLVAAAVLVFMKNVPALQKMPLYGINWIGMATWSIFILSLIYIFCYGEELGWFCSARLRTALGICLLSLSYGLWAMSTLRHPFIDKGAFSLRHFGKILLIFLVLDILLSAQTVMQNTFCSAVMGMDYRALADLKWLDFAGEAVGALFCCIALTKWHWRTRWMTLSGIFLVMLYELLMYLTVGESVPNSALVLPLVACGAGHIIIFISLTVYVQANCNFTYYFQMLCLLGFVRTGVGGPVGDAFFSRAMTALLPYNGLVMTLRELYGFALLVGVSAVVVILSTKFTRSLPGVAPRLRSVYDSLLRQFPAKRLKRLI